MARQVPQVKRKNSTNCKPPEARLTVVGSVAWRSGPREVATGSAVGSSATGGCVAEANVGSAGANVVGLGSTACGGADVPVTAEGAHEARSTVNKPRVGKKRNLLIVTSFAIGFRTRYIKKSLPEH
jgi:hypothetical protein